MFENVIVGVDGGASGRDAVTLARELAGAEATLTLAHIYGTVPLPGRTASANADERAAAEALALLETERDECRVAAELLACGSTSVGRGLHTVAEQRGADLLVVGARSRGLAGRVLAGDDTSAVLSGATCAVAVAPRAYQARSGGFLRIGVGYDFSAQSREALALARELAERDGAKLSACYVVTIPAWAYAATALPPNWGEIVEDDRAAAEARLGKLEGVEPRAVSGLAGKELACFGERVDLLVVGSRNYGPLRRLALGSTSQALARHARCALLVLPRTVPAPARRRRRGAQVSISLRSSA